MPATPLPIGNAYVIRVYLREFDAASNTYIPATGLTNVLATFTEDAAGVTAISVALTNIALAELSVSANPDNAGWYTATVSAADLSVLNAVQYLNTVIYRKLTIGSPVAGTDIQPLRVVLA